MQELLSGIVVDGKGVRHSVQLSCLVVPSLSQNLFSVKQAARNGVTHMLDIDNPRLEANNFTLLLQELGCGLYSFSLDLTDKICTQELVMQATAKATRWHRRLENLNHKCLDVVRKLDNNGVSFERSMPDCDVCVVGKSPQLNLPKTANRKVNHPFQLVFVDLMGAITTEALGGYTYVSKISDEHTEWTEICLLKSKGDALISLQLFV